VFVNGAGGSVLYSTGLGEAWGTPADLFTDDDNFCVTRINLIDKNSVDVDVLNFGTTASADPTPIPQTLIKIRL
jgi:hypothetical protein